MVPSLCTPLMALKSSAGMVTIRFQSESPSFKENSNQVSSVSLVMTSLTALTNEGFFELIQRPLLSRAVSSSLAETTAEPGSNQAKRPKFCLIVVIIKQISPDYNLDPP